MHNLLVESRPGSHTHHATRARRRQTLATLAAACLLVAAGCSAHGSHQNAAAPGSTSATTSGASSTPGLIPAGSITATIAAAGALHDTSDSYGIAADDTDVWVYNGEDGVLSRIATSTNKVIATVQLSPGCQRGQGCGNVALGDGAVWVANMQGGTITRVDAATSTIAATIPVGDASGPLVYTTPGAIWSANYAAHSFSRIDPSTNAINTTLPDHFGAESVVFGFGSIWLCDAHGPKPLTRLDATTLQVQAQIDLSHAGTTYACIVTAATDQSILVAAASTADDGSLLERVDPNTNQVTDSATPPGTAGVGLVVTPTHGWVADTTLGLFGLDPRTARPQSQLSIPTPAGLTVGAGSVWVMSSSGSLYRVTPTP